MNINDVLLNTKFKATVKCGKRTLTGGEDYNHEKYYIVSEGKEVLVESENEDEACRYLIGEK